MIITPFVAKGVLKSIVALKGGLSPLNEAKGILKRIVALNAYSVPNRTVIPLTPGHRFRFYPDSDSGKHPDTFDVKTE